MPRIEFAPEVADDFDRIIDHWVEHGVEDIPQRMQDIIGAISLLERHPMIGRPAQQGRRELVMGRASRGCIALYRYQPVLDMVFVLAIRSQRESGYARL